MNDPVTKADKHSAGGCLFHWLFNWRTIRRALIALACFATTVALFYTEENWRGKRAWENCKRELEASGMVLDWEKFISPPVPDNQNFFKAPGISESNWVGRGSRELSTRLNVLRQGNTNPLLIAEVTIVSPHEVSSIGTNATTLRLDDPAALRETEQLIRTALGPSLTSVFGFRTLSARPLNQIKPAAIRIASSQTQTEKELARLFPTNIESGHVRIKPARNNRFSVLLVSAVSAEDFVQSSDLFEADFDVIREALKRPFARIDCDYSQPAYIGIPNFITLRSVAQVLAERTKCYLLLGQPDKALRDLTLLHDICRITEAGPTGKPMTLVASMINVAITGLYANTIADGLRLPAWQGPQLVIIQEQLSRENLAPLVEESFREERVHATHTFEHMPRTEIAKLFDEKASLRKRLTDSKQVFLLLAPRGWFYQNMVAHIGMSQLAIATYNSTNDLFLPDKARMAGLQLADLQRKKSPYNFLTAMFLPNFTRAWLTVAHNQTLANEALVACALERFRIAHGEYPETLEALSPQFIEKFPHDVIGGQPLHYRRTDDGKFLLYSIGWNEKDDGGTTALNNDGKEDLENGDWVWGFVAK